MFHPSLPFCLAAFIDCVQSAYCDEVSAFLTDADTCSALPGASCCSHCRVPSVAQGGQGSAALTVL